MVRSYIRITLPDHDALHRLGFNSCHPLPLWLVHPTSDVGGDANQHIYQVEKSDPKDPTASRILRPIQASSRKPEWICCPHFQNAEREEWSFA